MKYQTANSTPTCIMHAPETTGIREVLIRTGLALKYVDAYFRRCVLSWIWANKDIGSARLPTTRQGQLVEAAAATPPAFTGSRA